MSLWKRWINIFSSPLKSTPLDLFINEIELDEIIFPKHVNRRLELTKNKLLVNCNVELAKYAFNIWRAESCLCHCWKDTESVAHYLFFCPQFDQYRTPHLTETRIFSLDWIKTLSNFIIDSGRFVYRTEKNRHYYITSWNTAQLVKIQNWSLFSLFQTVIYRNKSALFNARQARNEGESQIFWRFWITVKNWLITANWVVAYSSETWLLAINTEVTKK